MEREQLNSLVERAVDGDVQALTNIYYMQYNKVYFLAFKMLGAVPLVTILLRQFAVQTALPAEIADQILMEVLKITGLAAATTNSITGIAYNPGVSKQYSPVNKKRGLRRISGFMRSGILIEIKILPARDKVYYASITGLNVSDYSGTEEQRYKVSLEWLLFPTQTNL